MRKRIRNFNQVSSSWLRGCVSASVRIDSQIASNPMSRATAYLRAKSASLAIQSWIARVETLPRCRDHAWSGSSFATQSSALRAVSTGTHWGRRPRGRLSIDCFRVKADATGRLESRIWPTLQATAIKVRSSRVGCIADKQSLSNFRENAIIKTGLLIGEIVVGSRSIP